MRLSSTLSKRVFSYFSFLFHILYQITMIM